MNADRELNSSEFYFQLEKELGCGLKAGGKMRVIRYGDRIELLPARKAADLRGFLKGMDTSVPRDRDRV